MSEFDQLNALNGKIAQLEMEIGDWKSKYQQCGEELHDLECAIEKLRETEENQKKAIRQLKDTIVGQAMLLHNTLTQLGNEKGDTSERT